MKHKIAVTSMDFSADLPGNEPLFEPIFPKPAHHMMQTLRGYVRFAAIYFIVSSLIALCVVSFASDFSLLEIILLK